jgi:NADH oxidase (H2O2-forming)
MNTMRNRIAMRIVVIGGGASGSTAAQFARKTDRKAEIVLVSNESYPMYSRCGLPYALSGRIPSFEGLVEYTEAWFKQFKIDLRLGTEATAIDPKGKSVTLRKLSDGKEETVQYDSIIIATGATPWMPPMEGAYVQPGKLRDGLHFLRTIPDGKAIAARVRKGAKAVVVGAGLIGMETAEALIERGVDVTVVEFLPDILLASLDEDMAAAAHELVAKSGIAMHFRSKAVKITGDVAVKGVVIESIETKEQKELPCEIAVVSTGNRANTALAVAAGCALGVTKQIKVDARCATSVPGIFAVGDCTEYVDFITGAPVPIGMGTVATRQGRTAGINAAGGKAEMPRGILGTRVTEAFGMKMAGVGPSEAQLKKSGIEPLVGKFSGSTLPSYFPGGETLIVKVLAHPESGKLLGAQIVGTKRVHQRINAFAAAIMAGMGLEDFARLETAYAPPIAPTLDAITLACDVALMRLRRK